MTAADVVLDGVIDGPGGYTGCLTQVIREARQQRRRQAEETIPPQQ